MHRLFVGLWLPARLREACLAAMEDGPRGWAWQAPEQLHLTLRFIGEVGRHRAEDIDAALAALPARPLDFRLNGVGWFDQGPRGSLFARAEPRDALAALHAKIDHALVRTGLAPEGRAYLPHITLARRRAGAADPAAWLEREAALASEAVTIDRLTLFESHLSRHGAHYEDVRRYPLAPAADSDAAAVEFAKGGTVR